MSFLAFVINQLSRLELRIRESLLNNFKENILDVKNFDATEQHTFIYMYIGLARAASCCLYASHLVIIQ